MEWLLSWKLIVGAVIGALGVLYGLVQRRDRRHDLEEGTKAKVLLGRAYGDLEDLEAQLEKLRRPLPDDRAFRDILREL